jgi:hypothetical protein
MRFRLTFPFLLIAILFFLPSCGDTNPFLGKWVLDPPN